MMCVIKPLHCLFYTCSCWPTGWTCHMARWAASCAAAPGRRCSPASSCAMQICTLPPVWIWCITPSITSSWLLQSWCPTRLFLRHLQTLCHRRLLSTAILSQTKTEWRQSQTQGWRSYRVMCIFLSLTFHTLKTAACTRAHMKGLL